MNSFSNNIYLNIPIENQIELIKNKSDKKELFDLFISSANINNLQQYFNYKLIKNYIDDELYNYIINKIKNLVISTNPSKILEMAITNEYVSTTSQFIREFPEFSYDLKIQKINCNRAYNLHNLEAFDKIILGNQWHLEVKSDDGNYIVTEFAGNKIEMNVTNCRYIYVKSKLYTELRFGNYLNCHNKLSY